MANVRAFILKKLNSKSFKLFAPFAGVLVGGTYLLMQMQKARYKYTKNYQMSDEEAEKILQKYGEAPKESQLTAVDRDSADEWVNVRGPREEEYIQNKEVQGQLRQKAMEERQQKLKLQREANLELVKEKNKKRWEEELKSRRGISSSS